MYITIFDNLYTDKLVLTYISKINKSKKSRFLLKNLRIDWNAERYINMHHGMSISHVDFNRSSSSKTTSIWISLKLQVGFQYLQLFAKRFQYRMKGKQEPNLLLIG